MIRSMTGFGEAEQATDAGLARVEIKTVNHRFFTAILRTPQGFDRVEADIQSWLRAFIARGHVTYTFSIDRAGAGPASPFPELDLERARTYVKLLETVRSELGIEGAIEVSHIARFGEIFKVPERSSTPDVEVGVIRSLTEGAAGAVVRLREVEGSRLQADLEERLDAMEASLDVIEKRAPERLVEERDRLRAAVAELTESHVVDEDRLAREIAYLAEKWDLNEETVRFRSHLELFRETLRGEPPEPVGKRLGFIVQEMHREANTIGAKANDSDIGQASVALKEEIERLREQLENVE